MQEEVAWRTNTPRPLPPSSRFTRRNWDQSFLEPHKPRSPTSVVVLIKDLQSVPAEDATCFAPALTKRLMLHHANNMTQQQQQELILHRTNNMSQQQHHCYQNVVDTTVITPTAPSNGSPRIPTDFSDWDAVKISPATTIRSSSQNDMTSSNDVMTTQSNVQTSETVAVMSEEQAAKLRNSLSTVVRPGQISRILKSGGAGKGGPSSCRSPGVEPLASPAVQDAIGESEPQSAANHSIPSRRLNLSSSAGVVTSPCMMTSRCVMTSPGVITSPRHEYQNVDTRSFFFGDEFERNNSTTTAQPPSCPPACPPSCTPLCPTAGSVRPRPRVSVTGPMSPAWPTETSALHEQTQGRGMSHSPPTRKHSSTGGGLGGGDSGLSSASSQDFAVFGRFSPSSDFQSDRLSEEGSGGLMTTTGDFPDIRVTDNSEGHVASGAKVTTAPLTCNIAPPTCNIASTMCNIVPPTAQLLATVSSDCSTVLKSSLGTSLSCTGASTFSFSSSSSSSVPQADSSHAHCLELSRARLLASRFYLGRMSADEARTVLEQTSVGTYLLRDSSDPHFIYSISVQTTRGPTSIRIGLDQNSMFYLDSEPDQLDVIPRFDCVLSLVQFYTRINTPRQSPTLHQSASSRQLVSLEASSSGRSPRSGAGGDCAVRLIKPLEQGGPAPLMHLCRKAINGRLNGRSVNRLVLVPSLKGYLNEYPCDL